jgi:exodeoxyribonuclease V alpha subunit
VDTLRGRIRKITHRTEDYYVLSLETSSTFYGKGITVVGHAFGVRQLVEGAPIECLGEWVKHPKYGRQFSMHGWRPWAEDTVGVRIFLQSCMGLMPQVTEALVQAFGAKVFQVFADTPEEIAKVIRAAASEDVFVVGQENIEALVTEVLGLWSFAQTSADLAEFFGDQEVSSQQMRGIFRLFGAKAREVIEANPYELVRVDTFSFPEVDLFAQRFGVDSSDPRRYEGAVFWVLRESARNGHLCVRRGDLVSVLMELSYENRAFQHEPGLSEGLAAAVERLSARGSVVVDPNVGVYTPENYAFERDSARLLAQFIGPVELSVDLPQFLAEYQDLNGITLSPEQRAAVEQLASNRVNVLTGLPGTGKTTVIRTFVRLFEHAGISFALVAPTGIAAKRLGNVTGHPATTIHRMFRFNGIEWQHNRENKFPIGALIVDEMSMVDQALLFYILEALEPDTMLVFVGDDAQLPSVGPGNVLRELIHCPAISSVRLTQIFRQKETSDIVLNSHRINRGEGLVMTKGSQSEFRFVPLSDEAEIQRLIVQMAVKLKERDANFQVLSSKYDGDVGVNALNEALRAALNPPAPGKAEFSAGLFQARVGDRLMVIKNDHDLKVFNGDMGKLVGVDGDTLVVRIHGAGEDGLDMLVNIPRAEAASKLRLAYAITIHKAQGSEFDTVILPLVRSQGRMLQRNLFYTAVTRARSKCWLLGDQIAVQKAIANDKVILRGTAFGRSIVEAVKKLSDGVKEGHADPRSRVQGPARRNRGRKGDPDAPATPGGPLGPLE